jgi:hypothetical protein
MAPLFIQRNESCNNLVANTNSHEYENAFAKQLRVPFVAHVILCDYDYDKSDKPLRSSE